MVAVAGDRELVGDFAGTTAQLVEFVGEFAVDAELFGLGAQFLELAAEVDDVGVL